MEIRNVSSGNAERPRAERAAESVEFPPVPRDAIGDLADAIASDRLAKLRPPDAGTGTLAEAERALSARIEDRLEVSKASEALAAEEDPEVVTRRRAQVDAIREAIAEGKLVTPDRVERAVRKLLGN
jgi:anti-sigma28 factor (negative regulator of flagellin synthesis)